MKSNEIDGKKTKYFVIAIILLIILSVVLVIHFNNKSLVSGEDEEVVTTTTTVPITTKKKTTKVRTTTKVVEEVVADSTIYKSSIDEVNKLVYNYKITEEILENDKIVSTLIEVDDELKSNNVILLYDISLFDVNNIKKEVKNSLIEISIPLSKEMLEYDEYKVVYIDENGKITDEKFDSKIEDSYIKFTTSHLSKFAVIATKKVVEEEIIDLSEVTVDLKINDQIKEETNLYVKTSDKVNIIINNLEQKDYELYYLLLDESNTNEYKEFTSDMFKDIKTPGVYKLLIKLTVGEVSKIFELSTVNIYDEVFVYDKNEEVTETIVIGEIKDEEGNESDYKEMDKNFNIVIDDVTVKEESEESSDEVVSDDLANNDTNEEEGTVTPGEETDEALSSDGTELETDEEKEEQVEDLAKIVIKGNVYLVEETDISELEMTGHLIIDTNQDITFGYDEDKFDTSNLYTIYIKSKEFSINGFKFKYEYVGGFIVITQIDETKEENQVMDKETFESAFDGYEYDETKEDLILNKKEKLDETVGQDNSEGAVVETDEIEKTEEVNK